MEAEERPNGPLIDFRGSEARLYRSGYNDARVAHAVPSDIAVVIRLGLPCEPLPGAVRLILVPKRFLRQRVQPSTRI
jgi:hypothetical protein